MHNAREFLQPSELARRWNDGRREKNLSRRTFARIVASMALSVRLAEAEPAVAGRVAGTPAEARGLNVERHYQADAQVLLMGWSLLKRANVGAATVSWREYDAAAQARPIEFGGFSDPGRAAGLNRVGFIRELSRAAQDGGREFIYFGVMTFSAEESAEEARKALRAPENEQAFTAIDGRIGGGQTETTIAHFAASPTASGGISTDLLERAAKALSAEVRLTASGVAPDSSMSFLNALAAILQEPARTAGRYIYSGRAYELGLSRTADLDATEHFRRNGLIGPFARVIRVTAKTRRALGRKETGFRLWIEEDAERPLPLRIEYQPKTYLRLVFEATSAMSGV